MSRIWLNLLNKISNTIVTIGAKRAVQLLENIASKQSKRTNDKMNEPDTVSA